jgi:N-acetylneuraminate synthase
VAELSANHGGDLGRAVAIVHAAAEVGADAVKLQTFTPDAMAFDGDHPSLVVGEGTPWSGRRLHELYAEACTPWEWHEPLRDAAAEAGIGLFSTAFDAAGVELLEGLGAPVHKVASFELTDLSTGMATATEIDDAVRAARSAGDGGLMLLRCNSAYPAPVGEMDLATVPAMAERWDVAVGLSDHTASPVAAVAAVALGACFLEKHLTLSRANGGPDASFSLEPAELAETVRLVREAEAARGEVRFGPTEAERASLPYRRSVYAVADIAAGERFTADNVRVLRPAAGLPPAELATVLARRAARPITAGTPLSWELVEG